MSVARPAPPTQAEVEDVLRTVIDPELGADIMSLGMVPSVTVADDGGVTIGIKLTIGGCPLRADIKKEVEHRVGLHLGTRVTELALLDHEIRTDTGEQVRYDKLLLATGSSPRQLHLPGAELEGVLYLRTIEDSDRLRAAFRPGARVVTVGGGWIGLEAAAAAVEAGCSVTVLEALEIPLERVLGPKLASVFADLHREKGVALRTGVEVSAIEGMGHVRYRQGRRDEARALFERAAALNPENVETRQMLERLRGTPAGTAAASAASS